MVNWTWRSRRSNPKSWFWKGGFSSASWFSKTDGLISPIPYILLYFALCTFLWDAAVRWTRISYNYYSLLTSYRNPTAILRSQFTIPYQLYWFIPTVCWRWIQFFTKTDERTPYLLSVTVSVSPSQIVDPVSFSIDPKIQFYWRLAATDSATVQTRLVI